jgi:serine protease AprX
MRLFLPLVLILFLVFPFTGGAQTYYWIGFANKTGTTFSIENPSQYLSGRAIQRREKQQIAIDSFDLPVNASYVRQVLELRATFYNSSKWLNGVTIKTDSANFAERALKLAFVREVKVVKRDLNSNKSLKNKFLEPESGIEFSPIDTSVYGPSIYQVGQLNGQYLHKNNFRGQGKQIAVIDNGFYKANEFTAFDSLWANRQILGTRDFVNPTSNIFDENWHGMSVLSIIGGNIPGLLIGTAPNADYWLIRSEDAASEFLIEEYNWASAAEFADSVGVDVINTSLGYTTFDDSTMNHTYSDMNGHTIPVTKAANVAASRGMLVFAAAGNEGDKSWKYIIAPSDGDLIIAVGSVNKNGIPAPFTSFGPASDGDIKPNVAGVGWNTVIERSDGFVGTGSGASFSSPVLTGMAACLWQANPNATALQVKAAIEKSANLYNNPDPLLGYGIPDFQLADQILKLSGVDLTEINKNWVVYPNPFIDRLIIFQQNENSNESVVFEFIDINGRILKRQVIQSQPVMVINNLAGLPDGLIILKAKSSNQTLVYKLIKLK